MQLSALEKFTVRDMNAASKFEMRKEMFKGLQISHLKFQQLTYYKMWFKTIKLVYFSNLNPKPRLHLASAFL